MRTLVHRATAAIVFALSFGSGAGAADIAFTDQTAAAGLTFSCAVSEDTDGGVMDPGGAVGDFNRDGWPDLFLLGGGGAPDALFINNGDGTFTDRAADWRVQVAHRGHGVTVGDYDGDGWPDIYVTSGGDVIDLEQSGQHRLYRNEGDGSFSDVALPAAVASTSNDHLIAKGAAFGDVDLDGDLDLFVCTWGESNDGNRLFRNDGDGTFSDVTVEAGVFDPAIWGFSPRFVDMNGDRYPELLIAADYSSSRYFVNQGDGTFVDATGASGTGLDSNGMGQTVADFDNDGLLDWYVTSIYRDFPVGNNGNFLYHGRGNHNYAALPESAGAKNGGWGWGVDARDFDHDGFVDIAETNGWRLTEWENEPSYLFRNNGDLTFSEVHVAAGIDHTLEGRALLTFDYDRDGDMDLVIIANGGPVYLYRNDVAGSGTSWLEVGLDTSASAGLAPEGVGSRVTATVGAISRVVYLGGGATYLGQSQRVAHFGLGAATVVDELRIDWADGGTTALHDVPVDRILRIAAPIAGTPGEASGAIPFAVARDDLTGEIRLDYTPACGAVDHTIYFGPLADVASYGHAGTACNRGTSGSASFDPGGLGDLFFLIVGNSGFVEGSYGADGSGTERPADTGESWCGLPQSLAGSCDP